MTYSYTKLIAKAAKGTLTEAERVFLSRLERTGVISNHAASVTDADSDKDADRKKAAEEAAILGRVASQMALPLAQPVSEPARTAPRAHPTHTVVDPRDDIPPAVAGGHAERPIDGIAFKEKPADLRASVMKRASERSFAETVEMKTHVGTNTYVPETHAPKKLNPSFADVAAKGDIAVDHAPIPAAKKTHVVHEAKFEAPILTPPAPSFFN